jgi:glycerophosphoryl diester phosphodiesterase
MIRKLKYGALALLSVLFIVFMTFLVAKISAPDLQYTGKLAAYRGGGQQVNYKKLNENQCTARSIVDSPNKHVENTIESVNHSILSGANTIHLNVHRTKDNVFVVFHDWTVDCATNGKGEVRDLDFSYLEKLDAGFGYTPDDGSTYPFRDKGYKISKLEDYFNLFPNVTFWLNPKQESHEIFRSLVELIDKSNLKSKNSTLFLTTKKSENWFNNQGFQYSAVSVESSKSCVKKYVLYGWTGIFPEQCKNRPIYIHNSITRYIWGYPTLFSARAQSYDSEVYFWNKHTTLVVSEELLNSGIGYVTSNL